MHYLTGLVTLWCAVVVTSIPARDSRQVTRTTYGNDVEWVRKERAAPDTLVPLSIALQQQNLHLGPELLYEVANPDSPKYGQHWTAQKVADVFAPSQEALESVVSWLETTGISSYSISTSRSWIRANVTVEQAERLLDSKHYVYEHLRQCEVHLDCERYSVPQSASDHVELISTTKILSQRPLKEHKREIVEDVHGTNTSALNGAANSENCSKYITPDCIRALYQIPLGSSNVSGNELGIFESKQNKYDQPDLDAYFSHFASFVPNGTHPELISIDGGYAPRNNKGSVESMLDLGVAFPLIYPQGIKLFQTDDKYQTESVTGVVGQGLFDTFLDAVDVTYCNFLGGDNATIDPHYPDPRPGGYNSTRQCGVYNITNLVSFSWGINENRFPFQYQNRQCLEFLKLGLLGKTIIFASGDLGVAGRSCTTLPAHPANTTFSPLFPPSCPWVLAVGGTQLPDNSQVTTPEIAASLPVKNFSSSGVFSNYFSAPSYQSSTLSSWFATHDPGYPSWVFNRSGRGFPDVSASSVNFTTAYRGNFTLEDGTSAAAPIWGSIINLINEQRLRGGKGPVGFINPVLYLYPEVLNDVTEGSNANCHSSGFEAVKGWDPVTGLGTPNFPKLLDLFMSLP